MISTHFLSLLSCAAIGFLGVYDCGNAYAEDLPQAGKSVRFTAGNHCADYGPGFTAVEGSETCVKIGGHVRVEFGSRPSPADTGWARGSAAPAAMRSDSNADRGDVFDYSSHDRVRLRAGNAMDLTDPFRH
jgi:hypothetical protein